MGPTDVIHLAEHCNLCGQSPRIVLEFHHQFGMALVCEDCAHAALVKIRAARDYDCPGIVEEVNHVLGTTDVVAHCAGCTFED